MTAAKSKQPKKQEASTYLDTNEVPEHLQGVMGDQRGSEEVQSEDLIIPRIELVQGLSKVRKKNDPNFIEGAEEGMLYNVVTSQLYGEAVNFVPVYFRKEYLLWRDAELGGGFGGAFPSQAEAEQARQQMDAPDEWGVVDTNQHFVLVVHDDGSTEEAVISMAKTKAKASRSLNSMVRLNGGPRFSRVYEVKGVPEQSKNGQDYHTLKVRTLGFASKDIYDKAEALYETIAKGDADIDRTVDADADTEEAAEY